MGNPFRTKYRELTEAEKWRVDEIKDAAIVLHSYLNHPMDGGVGEVPQGVREFSLAKTNLEQAVMWAVKGVTG